MIGPSFSEAFLNAINIGIFHTSLNHSFLALIQKKKLLEMVADYRPIRLCNVLHKILSKV